MSNYTSMSERNSADKSADEHASTDYTQVASYAEQGEEAQSEQSVPLSRRKSSFKNKIIAFWQKLFHH